jgi:hypothetical protein
MENAARLPAQVDTTPGDARADSANKFLAKFCTGNDHSVPLNPQKSVMHHLISDRLNSKERLSLKRLSNAIRRTLWYRRHRKLLVDPREWTYEKWIAAGQPRSIQEWENLTAPPAATRPSLRQSRDKI